MADAESSRTSQPKFSDDAMNGVTVVALLDREADRAFVVAGGGRKS